jgi:hypothetical protein
MYENPELCKACGGECCRYLPGAAMPEDFGLPGEATSLLAALASGRWTIDWWEGDPRPGEDSLSHAYFVRPATKGNEGERYDPSWGGVCTFLSTDGCELPPEARPALCRFLEPRADGNCIKHGVTKQEASIAWLDWADLLMDSDGPFGERILP